MHSKEFFNSLDYIYIALMFFSTAMGFLRGFIKDFFSSCAWFGSGFGAIFLAPHLTPMVISSIRNEKIARVVALVLAYLILLIISLLIVGSISQKIRQGVLSGVDKAVGVLFGLFRGIALLICICLVMLSLDIPRNKYEIVRRSKLSPVLFSMAEFLMPQMSKLGLTEQKKLSISQKIVEESGKNNERGAKGRDRTEEPLGIAIKKRPSREKKVIQKIDRSVATPVKAIHSGQSGRRQASLGEEEGIQPTDEKESLLQQIQNKMLHLFSHNKAVEKIESNEVQQISTQESSGVKRAKYGSMSLLEARQRRREQRQATQRQKEIQKKLDKSNP
jgi:membrane protein required for colicin V production